MDDAEDFEAAFAPLLRSLEDPDARFAGQEMVDALQALRPIAPDGTPARARLDRELAVLQAKRGEPVCLDHADRAESTHRAIGALSDRQRFWMHYICADHACLSGPPERILPHADLALGLLPQDAAPLQRDSAAHYRAVGLKAVGRLGEAQAAASALAERIVAEGRQDMALHTVLGLLCDIASLRKDRLAAIGLQVRRIRIARDIAEPGLVISGLVHLARLQMDTHLPRDARQTFRAAEAFASTAFASAPRCDSNVAFVREERSRILR